MHYNLKGTDVVLTLEIRAYVERKFASLDKFVEHPGAERVDIELQFLRGEAQMYRAEFTFYEPELEKPLRASVRGATLHEAIDLAAADLFHEMTRLKKKRLHLFRRSALKVKEYLRGWRRSV